MNAKQAIQASDNLTLMLLNSSKEMAARLNISVSEAIDRKVKAYENNSKRNNEAIAWFLRGQKAKERI